MIFAVIIALEFKRSAAGGGRASAERGPGPHRDLIALLAIVRKLLTLALSQVTTQVVRARNGHHWAVYWLVWEQDRSIAGE